MQAGEAATHVVGRRGKRSGRGRWRRRRAAGADGGGAEGGRAAEDGAEATANAEAEGVEGVIEERRSGEDGEAEEGKVECERGWAEEATAGWGWVRGEDETLVEAEVCRRC
jgi:hypothetical protein